MTSEAQKRAVKKYDAENTRSVFLKLNTMTDADILDRLDQVESKQGYIKRLIRDDLRTRPLRLRKMIDLFDKFGAEQVEHRDAIHGDLVYYWNRDDFASGGKMERFADYTVERFEREFDCVVMVG